MTEDEALREIRAALAKVSKDAPEIAPETDLIGDEILDSLDGMVFLLELENQTGRTLPEDIDLVAEGYYSVRKLIDFLCA